MPYKATVFLAIAVLAGLPGFGVIAGFATGFATLVSLVFFLLFAGALLEVPREQESNPRQAWRGMSTTKEPQR